METKSRTIWLYIITNFLFWGGVLSFDGLFSIYVIEKAGWAPTISYIPAAIMHISIGVFELPTGAFGDIFGRLYSTRVGFAIIAASFLILGFFEPGETARFFVPILFSVVFALGWTFTTGSFSAWLIETLKIEEPGIDLAPIFARVGFYTNISTLGFSSLYSLLVKGHSEIAWIFAGTAVGISLIASFFLKDFHRPENLSSKEWHRHILKTIGEGIAYVRGNLPLRYLMVMNASIYGLTALIFHSILYQSKNLSSISSIGHVVGGYIWPISMCATLLGSYFSRRLLKYSVFKSGHATFVATYGSLFLFLAYSLIYISGKNSFSESIELFLGLSITVRVVRSATSPWTSAELNNLIADGKIRATVLSVDSLFMETFAGGLGILVSSLVKQTSVLPRLWLLATLLVAGIYSFSLIAFLRSKRVRHD